MIHELKTWQPYFEQVKSGLKTFELRENDRDFKIGDELLLKEYSASHDEFTGNFCHRRVDFILHGGRFGLEDGFCILGLSKI